jgi:uncharacterized DUF497 family protein
MFAWDEKKRLSNLEKHGLDFVDASLVYDSPVKITVESRQRDEDRLMDMAMVKLAESVLVLVYTMRGEDIRVISFRRASRVERRFYEQAAS